MICYKDKTFCSASCKNTNCPRHYTDEIHEAACQWWGHDPDNAPIAFSDFSPTCKEYQPR